MFNGQWYEVVPCNKVKIVFGSKVVYLPPKKADKVRKLLQRVEGGK